MIDCADKIVTAYQWVAFGNLCRSQPLVGHAHGFGRGGIQHVFIHAVPGLGHPQVANDAETRIEPGFLLKRLVILDRIQMDMAGCIAHVEKWQQPGCVPCRTGCQFITFEQQNILPAGSCEVIGNRNPDSTTSDNQCLYM